MQAVRTWTYTLPVRIRAQISLLVPVMCFVYDVVSGYSEQGVFFMSHCGWTPLCCRTHVTETCIGISYASLLLYTPGNLL
jgi:hypothetical protein